jgi:hypothetical protein
VLAPSRRKEATTRQRPTPGLQPRPRSRGGLDSCPDRSRARWARHRMPRHPTLVGRCRAPANWVASPSLAAVVSPTATDCIFFFILNKENQKEKTIN